MSTTDIGIHYRSDWDYNRWLDRRELLREEWEQREHQKNEIPRLILADLIQHAGDVVQE